MLLALTVGLFCSSCSKDDDKDMIKITNVSGMSFYDCSVHFRDSKDGELIGYEKVGDILNDNSVKVRKQGNYFSIMGKTSTGRTFLTYELWSSEQVKIFKSDLLAY